MDATILGSGVVSTERSLDRFAMAHDASHYLLIPDAVLTPSGIDDIPRIFRASRESGRAITFRSGGTSLSGQAVSDSVLVDTRKHFQGITVRDDGRRVTVQPGATVRLTNAHLLRYGRKLGPDPASEIACTIGGVIANNSSGMACGIEQNTYRTLESMVFVLPSGTTIDTATSDATDRLRQLEPALYSGLLRMRSHILGNPSLVDEIRRQYSMKNTMGYGINSFLDYERPVDVLAHLIVGSEGTLAFVGEATFRTVEILPHAATGLLVFPDLRTATAALPRLVGLGLATIELMDALSLRVSQQDSSGVAELARLDVTTQAAYLVEFQERTADALQDRISAGNDVLRSVGSVGPFEFTTDPAARAALWHVRKGLYTTVAGARPSGTTALLEDIVVPVEKILTTCEALTGMFDRHGYEGSVIFGHAKDGNIHFMLNERFDDPACLARYERFTEEMVDLVLEAGGNLKAEHGTGRIMAPFVRRQFGDELFGVMLQVKRLCDPAGILNPGVLLSDDPDSYLRDLKPVPTIDAEVDRCVECGYCEPTCPSKNLTMTPRQRIVARRELAGARERGDAALIAELEKEYEYDGVDTCAVDGLCAGACPVGINTGDLVKRLRAEASGGLAGAVWNGAARNWNAVTGLGGVALTVAKAMPAPLVAGATTIARSVLGAETMPLYSGLLPSGGARRPRATPPADTADAVFFAACIGTMFGPEAGGGGATSAFLALCDRAGVVIRVPERLGGMCCGTPWKSKGHVDGYAEMSSRVLPALLESSERGLLPIVCDAASCTEGLVSMRSQAMATGSGYSALRFVDSVQFVAERILPSLTLTAPVPSIAVHHTCSSVALGVNAEITAIARFMSHDVLIPTDWGCCAFAGDRGLLHPELTASATAREAAEVIEREYTEYVSVNRTCELGMTRATGRPYRHILEVLEVATRPVVES